MCLGIPGQVTELLEVHEHLARVDVSGVGRVINIGLLEDEDLPRSLGGAPHGLAHDVLGGVDVDATLRGGRLDEPVAHRQIEREPVERGEVVLERGGGV